MFSVRYVHMPARLSARDVLAEERPDLLPAVVGRLHPVGGPVHREESVACALVSVELVRLAEAVERRRELSGLLGRGVLVVGAEQPEQRAGKVLAKADDRLHSERQALWHPDDGGAIAVDRR